MNIEHTAIELLQTRSIFLFAKYMRKVCKIQMIDERTSPGSSNGSP